MNLATRSATARLRLMLLAGTAALAAPQIASAQTVDDSETPAEPPVDGDSFETQEDSATGNVIIVTATKRAQTLQEIPVAVSVATAETLERAQIRDLKDLQTQIPSLRVDQLQSSANTNFLIRGFGNGANNAGIEPSVGVFVDGVYRSRTASQITDLPDVERIEVLRGPQSTLFGKNASAGVISIVTKEPEFEFGGLVDLSYGNYNAIVAKGLVTGPIMADTLAFSLAGGVNMRDGYLENPITGTDSNDRDRWFARGQLLFDNGSPVRARLIADYDKIDEICCGVVNLRRSAASNAILAIGGQIPDPNDPFADVIYTNLDSTNDIENYGVSGQLEYDLGAFRLTSITGYRRSDLVTDQDSDFTSADLLGRNFADLNISTFTQEARISGEIGERLNVLLGAFYFNEDIEQRNELYFGDDFRSYANLLIQGASGGAFNVPALEATIGALTGRDLAGDFFIAGQGLTENYTLDNEALSIFGQADFEIADGLVLTLGANYTDDKKRITTDVVSTDVFSNLDLQQVGSTAIFAQAFPSQVGTAFGLGRPATQAEIASFLANPQTAPIVGQIQAGVQAFAAANAANPALNPFLALRTLQFLPPFLNVPNSVEDGRTADTDWSYTARLAYDVSPTLNVYLSYATGFKASSFNLSRDSRPLASDLAAIRAAGLAPVNLTTGSRFAGPEDTTVYELGIKGNWDFASGNLTFFRQTIDGFQSNIFTGTGFALANAGEQETFGIEFDSIVRPTDELTLNVAFTYLDAKFNSFVGSSVGDLSGFQVANVPEISASFGGQYDREINAAGDRIILTANYHYEAPTQIVDGLPAFYNPRDPSTQPIAIAAARPFRRQIDDVSASITYAFGMGLELSVWGRNLLDDRYITTVFDSVAQAQSVSGYPNQPRTYGVAARYRF